MNISTWLDKKTAEKIDVSHIALPADISYDNDSDAGITAEVKTRKPAFIHQK
jgi:hypothetical protein